MVIGLLTKRLLFSFDSLLAFHRRYRSLVEIDQALEEANEFGPFDRCSGN